MSSISERFLCAFMLSFLGSPVWASSGITYQGRLLGPNNVPVTSSNVQFKIQIRTPGVEDCLLYEEIQTIDLSMTSGAFALSVGNGTGTRTDAYAADWNLFESLSNRKSFNFSSADRAGANMYTPSPADNRTFRLSFNLGSGWESLPVQTINYIPMSIETYAVGGFPASSLLRVEDAGNLVNTSPLSNAQYTELLALISGSSSVYEKSGQLGGSNLPSLTSGQTLLSDGSGGWTAGVPVDTSVESFARSALPICTAGQALISNGSALSCVSVASGTLTESDIPTLTSAGNGVDGGAISGTIGGSTVINTSGDITTTGNLSVSGSATTGSFSTRQFDLYESTNTHKISFLAPSSLSDYTLTFPVDDGASGQVLSTDGSGVLSWISPSTGSVASVSGTSPIQVSGTTSVTISVDDATTSAKGVVQLAASTDTTTGLVVQANDTRLTDSRSPSGTAGGDLSGTYPNPTVAKIQGVDVDAVVPASDGQVLRYDGVNSKYVANFLSLADIRSTVMGHASSFPSTSCTSDQTLTWSSLTDTLACTDINNIAADKITSGTIDAARLGSGTADGTTFLRGDGSWSSVSGAASDITNTPSGSLSANDVQAAIDELDTEKVAKAGDTMTGALTMKAQSEIQFADSDSSNYVGFKAPASIAADKVWTLPGADGSSGQVLSTDGSGVLSWISPGGGGTVTEVTSANTDIAVATTTTTPQLTLNSGTGPNQIVKLDGSSQLPTVSGANLTDVNAEKLQGNAVASGAPTGGLLTWNTTSSQWEATNPPSCSTSQALKWDSVTSTWSCVDIALSSGDVTGLGSMATEDASDYLLKSGNLSGLTNTATARTNLDLGSAAVKTAGTAAGDVLLLDGSGRIPASAVPTAVTTNTVSADTISADTVTLVNGIKIGTVSTACNAAAEGTIRYNSTDKKMEFCNGTDWKDISSGVLATLSLGSPSSSLVQSGPVDFVVTYGSGVDTATITLSPSDISLGGTATSGCTVTGVTGTGSARTVTVDNCAGTGTVNISVAAGTAKSTTGDSAAGAGPSTSYQVDNAGPPAPTGVTLGSVPSNLTNTPTISYTLATDVGGSTVANHQVKIMKTSDSSVAQNWVNHTSGSDIDSLALETNTQYEVYVRAVDALGNIGTESTATTWTTINDPCFDSPSPGDTCTGGAIYLGSLSPGALDGGSNTDYYMATPGGCTNSATPTCSGTDSLTKAWYGSGGSSANIAALVNYTSTLGTGHGATNTDQHYGDDNTAAIVAHSSIGPDSAAAYCDNLDYGGYTDWYLPNRYELNLFFTNKASLPGLRTGGSDWYWTSTEYSSGFVWHQRFSDGNQGDGYGGKGDSYLVRCVRRY